MLDVKIKLLTRDDANALYAFEKENRTYFQSIGLARKEAYYKQASFIEIFQELLSDQEKGLHYMYSIRDRKDQIVGRVNLTNVVREPFQKAELGYRIGQAYQGKGYATQAVRLLLKQAYCVHKLHRLEAGTTPDHIASQIVLIRNGFQFVGKYNQYILQGNTWQDSLLFEKILG